MSTVRATQFGLDTARTWISIPRHRQWLIWTGAALAALVLTAAALLFHYWPYRFSKIKPLLEDTFGCQIAIQDYHRTYFPNPGFVARGLTLRRKSAPNQPPIATVEQLMVHSHWADLFLLRRRVHLFQMEKVHLVLPPPGSQASKEDFPPGSAQDFSGPDTPVQRFEVRNMQLEIRRAGGGSYVFPVHQLHIENMQSGKEWTFAVDMHNAIPTGHIEASGRFGPLSPKNVGTTPLSGQFRFTNVNLHDVGNIRGDLSSYGHFQGHLEALNAEATTATPNFAVDNGHPSPVAGAVRCTINALNGDVFFQDMEARTGSTLIRAKGQVAGAPKSTNLDIAVANGRAQDILRPFLRRNVPISGPVSLHAHAYLAPRREGGFFERLKVDGGFEIPAERLTDQRTEQKLTEFSQRAQGQKPSDPDAPQESSTDAVSAMTGPASIRNAVVSTHKLTFNVAGAQATLDGTFNLHTSAAHLTGTLAMKSDISHTESGFKSFLIKPLAPFFKKKHAGAVVPIAVIGTPGHYKVEQNLTHSK